MPTVDDEQLNADTQAVVAQLRSGAVIQTDPQYVAAGQLYRTAKQRETEIKAYFGPMKKAAHEAHKAVTAKENDVLALIVGPMATIKAALEKYDAEKRRKAREEAERLETLRQEELRKQAEALRAAQPDISPLEEAMQMEAIEESMPAPVSLPVAAAPKLTGVVYRTAIDRDKVQARLDREGFDHGIPGISVWCEFKFSVSNLADVPEVYKKRV